MTTENKCAHLFDDNIKRLDNPLVDMFKMQASLQKKLALTGRAVDYDTASYKEKVDDITKQWRNMNMEMTELLERLPWKDWKTYSPEALAGFTSEEQRMETLFEYVDVLHFFMNVGLALGVDGDMLEKLYIIKNKENFDRQARGY